MLPVRTGRAAPSVGDVAAGERIYRQGILPNGQPLHGWRPDGITVDGSLAACISCHRRSGLGSFEGPYLVPPITAKYLHRSAEINAHDTTMAHVQGYQQRHPPYTDRSLAKTLRTGIAPDGRKLEMLMPRFTLDDESMRDLIAYLDQLGETPVPGVGENTLDFATIVTPDADPVARDAMLDVLHRFFSDQAAVIAAETRPMHAAREIRYRVTRAWRLHVWRLHGDPSTWERQLRDDMNDQPVFAVISGIGRGTWAPVQRFCESAHVPCLFPNIDDPVVDPTEFYTVYYSRGVRLEADLLANWLAKQSPDAWSRHRLVQIARRGDAGIAGSQALARRLREAGWRVDERTLRSTPRTGDVAEALRGLGPEDALALWLRPDDLRALPAKPPTGHVLISGLMGGLDAAPLNETWRRRVEMSYPVDLPESRLARMNFPYGWFRFEHVPITAPRVQVDTYLACVITSETVGQLFDSFVPDFLLERMEMMLSRRLANAYFPRLGLAPGERFASKGGYVVHFDPQSAPVPTPATADGVLSRGVRVIADTDWVTP